MRAVVQCVSRASVTVDDQVVGSIGKGFVILLGVGHGDTEVEAERLWRKISKLRVFDDAEGKTNLSLVDVGGEVLVVSQFTLYANCRKGNRPSFTEAGDPAVAERLYEHFAELARQDGFPVATGRFGAMMDVALVNHGPFTLWLDTEQW
ncbi:D-aminoacyl-tRNA deacylase [uncultured Adlercreutzia sp.]|uniref:D-aminoacyl-tRNA deacylase n=1 Tax=uncultured Adlercreutzia sp. TaxID=875803 RepID=UPI0025EE0D27|nr:D-aminoacyl-tRNA deacylase [uncultured Adlercreutzia sp.]MCI9262633.1 D-tyrosyl-tRNA(Tyr) deacylase [Eggerthellaceae bacterium]